MAEQSLHLKLLRQIDSHQASLPTQQSMFDPPSNIYFSILHMYNKFKKENEIEILQNKIYRLKIKDEDNTDNYMEIEEQRPKKQVSIHSLCAAHPFDFKDISNLLKMKQYLPKKLKKDIVCEIIDKFASIDTLNVTHLPMIFQVFKRIMRSDDYLNTSNPQLSEYIQTEMMKILLKTEVKDKQGFDSIAYFLIGLPSLNQNILSLISQLYCKITQNSQFIQLEKVYWYIYNKLDDDIKIKSIKNHTMISITIPKHLELIKSQILSNYKEISTELSELARIKMHENFTVLTDKTQNMIDFIFMVILLDNSLWVDFIIWVWKLPEVCRQYANTHKLEALVCQVLSKPIKQILPIFSFLSQNENQFEVSSYFVDLILNRYKRYLMNVKIRKFLASKILLDQSFRFWDQIVSNFMEYIDVIFEMLTFRSAEQFFRGLLENNPEKSSNFFALCRELADKAPLKFKELYVKIDKGPNTKILSFNENLLIHLLGSIVNIHVYLSLVRALSEYIPSEYCMVILTKIYDVSSKTQEQKLIKVQIMRTLNIILCTNKYKDLNQVFKHHLKEFSQRVGEDYTIIFKDIPEEMNTQLSKFYN